jgi:hypothetical protein
MLLLLQQHRITFGALPNHHCTLSSIDLVYPDPPYNDALLSRFTDPGAGAISYGSGRDFFTNRDLAAGEEIFLNYGVCSRVIRMPQDPPSWQHEIPMPVDFTSARSVALHRWNEMSEAERQDSTVALEWPDVPNHFVKSLLPTLMSELRALAAVRGSGLETTKLLATVPRTVDWIKANGLCLENIVPKQSTIPGAGKGAFAQFVLVQGEIVVPSPMMHILDKEALNVYDDDWSISGTQLLMNYCLNHPDTPIFLCPNTNAVLLNHCSRRQPSPQCPDGPNAAFRWASGWNPDSEKWQAMMLEEIANQEGRSLAMEVVALREIAVGDEIFVDYGLDWETAWDAHVKSWKPSEKITDEWITAKEANEQGAILPAFISGDLREEPSHPYLFTGCIYKLTNQDEDEDYHTPYAEWKTASDEELLRWYADDGAWFRQNYSDHPDYSHWPCNVLKDNGDGTYIVQIQQSPHFKYNYPWSKGDGKPGPGGEQPWEKNGVPRLLTNYPRWSIHYFPKPYQSDQHLPSAFRHAIGMPEELVPQQWKTKTSFGDHVEL